MLKKTIAYTDLNGEERKEDYYFNLTQRELEAWDLSTPGGLEAKFNKIIDKKEGRDILEAFYELLSRSYGEKTDDGRFFVKKKNGVPLFEMFEQSPAFDVLYEELCTNAETAAAFFNAIIAPDLAKKISENSNKISG